MQKIITELKPLQELTTLKDGKYCAGFSETKEDYITYLETKPGNYKNSNSLLEEINYIATVAKENNPVLNAFDNIDTIAILVNRNNYTENSNKLCNIHYILDLVVRSQKHFNVA